MGGFKDFLIERQNNKKEADPNKMSSNTKGVLHELLVGYHLNGGVHMEKHKDIDGLSPQEAHDKLKATVSPEAYKRANERAAAAAEDIRKRVGKKVVRVHWTSKAGDIERSTGIKSSQQEDPSDLVLTDEEGRHHGISLKTSDKKNAIVPISNPGAEALPNGTEALANHRSSVILANHPDLNGKNKDSRKEWMDMNPQGASHVKSLNGSFIKNLAKASAEKMAQMSKSDLVQHIRHRVLHARQTPMQELGHNHIRHTTLEDKNGFQFTAMDPSKDYEHILSEPQHIDVTHRGTSIIFTHKGKEFARHRLKWESGSDPLSSLKGSGEELPYVAKSREAKVQQNTDNQTIGKTGQKGYESSNQMFGKPFHAPHELNNA